MTASFFLGALYLLFIGLKLVGSIDWAWVWVFALLWAPFAAGVAVVVGAGLVAVLTQARGHS